MSTKPNTGCECSADSNQQKCSADWDPQEEVNRLLNSIDENETDLKKIAETAHKCLNAMSLNDACEYMIRHQYPITDENIKKFMSVATQSYLIRFQMMKDLVLK